MADTGTYEAPRQFPKGIEYVIVGGEIVVEKGTQRFIPAGTVIRKAV